MQADEFYSTYFLILKKDVSLRLLDLWVLNRFLNVLLPQMLSTCEVVQAICPGEWFTSIDLRDAYVHVPIHPEHRKYLRSAFQSKVYQFTILPFSLSVAPRMFMRCMKAALRPICQVG